MDRAILSVADSESRPPSRRCRPELLSLIAAAVLLATWLLPPTSGLWRDLDEAAFRWLNGSLAWGRPWQVFWALANWRVMDLAPAGLVLLVSLDLLEREPRERRAAWAGRFLLLALALTIVPPITHALVCGSLSYFRDSPTLVYEDSIRLTQLVSGLKFKDASSTSFPGDHGFVLLTCAAFFWRFTARRSAILVTLIAVGFVLPRLVVGAHWLSDVIVGGGVMALIASAITFAPAMDNLAERLCSPHVRRIERLMQWWHGRANRAVAAGSEAEESTDVGSAVVDVDRVSRRTDGHAFPRIGPEFNRAGSAHAR